jgi:hypothetical protein
MCARLALLEINYTMPTPEPMIREHESVDGRRVWYALSTYWLRLAWRTLATHSRARGHGTRGVLSLKVDTPDFLRMLTAPGTAAQLETTWVPAGAFTAAAATVVLAGHERLQRWEEMLAVMDPARDTAVFLHSTPRQDGQWYARLLVGLDQHVATH